MTRSRTSRSVSRQAPARLQSGQALAEMAILAAVLIPLFILVSTFGKYIYMKQATQQAARAAAWEATVMRDYVWANRNEARVRQLLIDRHFGLATDRILTQPTQSGGTTRVRSVMTNSWSGKALVERNDVVLAPYVNEDAGVVMQALESVGNLLESLPGEFPPNKNGLVTAKIDLRPQNLRTSSGTAPNFLGGFENLDLQMTASHTVLTDSWNAAGNGLDNHISNGRDRSVIDQVNTLVPSSNLEPLGEILEDLSFLEILPVVGVLSRYRPGYIQPDIVPKHKLKPYNR